MLSTLSRASTLDTLQQWKPEDTEGNSVALSGGRANRLVGCILNVCWQPETHIARNT